MISVTLANYLKKPGTVGDKAPLCRTIINKSSLTLDGFYLMKRMLEKTVPILGGTPIDFSIQIMSLTPIVGMELSTFYEHFLAVMQLMQFSKDTVAPNMAV